MNLTAFTAQTTARQTAARLERDNEILRSIAERGAAERKDVPKRSGRFGTQFALRIVRAAH